MVGETLTEMWFNNIWKNSLKNILSEPVKPVLGILAFEVSRLMSKLVHIWQCLSDRQISRLREEIANSVGIQKLVSADEDYLMDLALAEIIDNLASVAKSVAVLGKKCADPTYQNLESISDDLGESTSKWYGWQYRLKKMDKQVKKMEKFVAATEQLYSELDELADHEQSLRRMQAGASIGKVRLLEFQQKVLWKRQEVRNLQEMSPWVRTYDYIVRLLLRSVFTIIQRIKYVYGVHQYDHSDYLVRTNSMSALLQTSVHSSESHTSGIQRSHSNLGSAKNRRSSPTSILCGKHHHMKGGRRFATGCMTGGSESPALETHTTTSCGSSFRSNSEIKDTSFFNSKLRLLNAPPSALGYAALSLHYANIIMSIEKLASAPHLISLDARDDLYNKLPLTIRRCLREKLRKKSRTLHDDDDDDDDDDAFVAEWSLALERLLEWLCPLAHNMVRWQSERNFERQQLFFGSNVLLVQTLFFADQVETEEAIVELLIGLNYLFRFGGNIDRPFAESSVTMIDHTP